MTRSFLKRCPACESPASIETLTGQVWEVNCTRCGPFRITDVAETILRGNQKSLEQIANISGYVRENSGTVINQNHTDFLFTLRTPTLWEKALRIFQRVAQLYPHPGQNIDINIWGVDNIFKKIYGEQVELDEKWIKNCTDVLPWLSYGWIPDGNELYFIVWRFLREEKRYLNMTT